MVSIYCTVFNLTLAQVRNIVEYMFPQNQSSIVECGTVFLSNGDVFECSAEPGYCGQGLYLSAEYHESFTSFEKTISELKSLFEKRAGIYDIEYEIEKDGAFTSYFIRHPAYERRVSVPSA